MRGVCGNGCGTNEGSQGPQSVVVRRKTATRNEPANGSSWALRNQVGRARHARASRGNFRFGLIANLSAGLAGQVQLSQ